jgi:hypothetical protein
LVSLAEAQDVLSRQKVLASDMVWASKRGKIDFQWIEARIALQFLDEFEVAEQLVVICQWRKKGRTIPEHWTFGLLYRDERIYAIDVQPTSIHENDKAGKGKPYYLKEIDGIHEHIWTEEARYGYAEPINVPIERPDVVWKMFCKRANIIPSDFDHPDNGQPELL